MKTQFVHFLIVGLAAAPFTLAQEKPRDDKALLEQAINAVNRAVGEQESAAAEAQAAAAASEKNSGQTSSATGRLVDAGKKLADEAQKEKDARALLRKAKERMGLPVAPETAGTPPTGSPIAVQNKEEMNTYIVGEDEAIYESQSGVAIFEKHVRVIRPDLRIWCDQLDVQLKVEQEGAATKPATTQPTPTAPGPTGMDTDNLKQAIAKAKDNMVVIWRKTGEGEILATCREAIYDGATGNLILKQSPEVLKDRKIFIKGADESAEITVLKNGRYTGRVSLATVRSATEAKALRQRLLSHIPKKSGSDTADQDAGGSDSGTNSAAPADAPRAESQPLNNLPPLPQSGRPAAPGR